MGNDLGKPTYHLATRAVILALLAKRDREFEVLSDVNRRSPIKPTNHSRQSENHHREPGTNRSQPGKTGSGVVQSDNDCQESANDSFKPSQARYDYCQPGANTP